MRHPKLFLVFYLLLFSSLAFSQTPPALVSPISNAVVTVSSAPASVSMKWQTVANASGYELNIDGNQVLINSGSQTSYNATLGSGAHTWKARTKNSSGSYGSWSGSQNFSVSVQVVTLNPPALVSPVGNAVVTVTSVPASVSMNWETVANASGYELNIDGNQVLINSGSQTSYNASLGSGTHTWKARTIDQNNIASDWSPAEQFIVSLPQTSDFIYPVDDYVSSICFEWRNLRSKNSLHCGEDVKCNQVGLVIKSSSDGVVKFARAHGSVCDGNWGDLLVIEALMPTTNQSVCFIYGHLNILVNEGDYVNKGQTIGTIKRYNCRFSPHLHFGVFVGKYDGREGVYPAWLRGYLPEESELWQHYQKPSTFISNPNYNCQAVQELKGGILTSYPNPFNPSTSISYELKSAGVVQIQVFDQLGRLVETLVDGSQIAGIHNVAFNGARLPSGVYYCMLKTGAETVTKKLLLLK